MKFFSFSYKGSLAARHLLFVIGFSFLLTGCQWGDQIESLVQPNPDDFAVLYTDTTTVQLSTVLADSVMTGGASRLLVGRYVDPYFGKIQTATFFQPTAQSGVTIPENAKYDSLILSLKYDLYSYGDTTKTLNLSVHKLLADILSKDAYYNTNSTAFDPTPLGKLKLVPTPRRAKRLTIRLSDVLGSDIFEKGKANLLTSNQDWINLVNGLLLKSSATDDASILGFDSVRVQMHYHVPDVDIVRKDSTVFQSTAAYNQIITDRSGTAVANLIQNQRTPTPSAKTGNMAFIQAGRGITIRVDLPTLRELRNIKYTAANKAFLRITPVRLSVTDQLKAVPEIHVFRVNKNNEYYVGSTGFPLPLYSLSPDPMTGAQSPVSGKFINDIVNNKQYYLLDITSYVAELLTSESEDVGGLLLRGSIFNGQSTSFPDASTEFTTSLNRLVIGDQKSSDPGVKLELYYTNVKAQ